MGNLHRRACSLLVWMLWQVIIFAALFLPVAGSWLPMGRWAQFSF